MFDLQPTMINIFLDNKISFFGVLIPMGRLRNPSEQHEQKLSEEVVANLLFE